MQHEFSRGGTSVVVELEGLIREALAVSDFDRIQKIVHQLCHEYAYAVHQPHARNGGLIGLAAASIALGPVGFPTLVLLCFPPSPTPSTTMADQFIGGRSLP